MIPRPFSRHNLTRPVKSKTHNFSPKILVHWRTSAQYQNTRALLIHEPIGLKTCRLANYSCRLVKGRTRFFSPIVLEH